MKIYVQEMKGGGLLINLVLQRFAEKTAFVSGWLKHVQIYTRYCSMPALAFFTVTNKAPFTGTPHRVKKSASNLERSQPIIYKRRTGIIYPPMFGIHRKNSSFFINKSEDPQKNSKTSPGPVLSQEHIISTSA